MIKITSECVWCENDFRVTLSEALFPFTARKYCHKNCNDAHVTAIKTSEEFAKFFISEIKGECFGAVKTYSSYFPQMIFWPDWSPRGEKRRADAQLVRLAEQSEYSPPAP